VATAILALAEELLATTIDPGFLAVPGADLAACYVVRPPGRALATGSR
jgi:hypothetical protein